MVKIEFVYLVKPENSLRSKCSFPNQISYTNKKNCRVNLTALSHKEEKNVCAWNRGRASMWLKYGYKSAKSTTGKNLYQLNGSHIFKNYKTKVIIMLKTNY